MSAVLVNLRRVRKAKARDDRANEAAVNRVLHGRTRGEKVTQASVAKRLLAHLDAHRLDGDRAAEGGQADDGG